MTSNQHAEDHLPSYRIRPRFEMNTDYTVSELVDKIRTGLNNGNGPVTVATRFKALRHTNPETGQPYRNVLMMVFTDEAGNDQHLADATIQLCDNLTIPVYVIGVPAPFGRATTKVKWVDPDPQFDQSPAWSRVDQGPESLYPERLQLHSIGYDQTIDSGFGPFSLTRLCRETGGIYFAVHPNRNMERAVGRGETVPFSSHMRYFFDPDVM